MGTFAGTAIVDYHLSFVDQGKQTSVFPFCLQQTTEVCRFRFPFAANERKLPFFISSIFHLQEFRKHVKHGDMEMETWKHKDIDMRLGNMEKWRHGDKETGDMNMET